MNWLAHVFLSEQKIDFQMGNFLADPLKGRLWEGASSDMARGMHLHKLIDAYTDSHQIFSKSKARLREKGLLKPVIIDLTYDYFLTKNWDTFSIVTKDDFLAIFYHEALKRSNYLSKDANQLIINLVEQDRLNKYNNLDQLKKSFERIDIRLSPRLLARETAVSYFENVKEHVDALEADFLTFFPLLCTYVKTHSESHHLKHWNF